MTEIRVSGFLVDYFFVTKSAEQLQCLASEFMSVSKRTKLNVNVKKYCSEKGRGCTADGS